MTRAPPFVSLGSSNLTSCQVVLEPFLDLLDPGLFVSDPLEGDEHRVGLSIRTDGRDVVVACLLVPIGRKRDPHDGLAILANDGFSAGLLRRTGCGRAEDLRRCFVEVRVLGILVFSGGLVLGTRLRFPINGGAGRAGNHTNLGACRRSFAPANHSADDRSAHATADRPPAALRHGVLSHHEEAQCSHSQNSQAFSWSFLPSHKIPRMLEPGNVPGSFEAIAKASVQLPFQVELPRLINGDLDKRDCPAPARAVRTHFRFTAMPQSKPMQGGHPHS